MIAHLVLQNQNRSIHGITVNELESILAQFADDTNLFLEYNYNCLEAVCQTFKNIEENIGLKISYEKTNVYRVGSLKNSNAKLYTSKELNWTNKDIHTLGVYISCSGDKVEKNFTEIMTKVHNVIDNGCNRTLTLIGKILTINTLIGSLFVYRMNVMLDLDKKQIGTINDMIMKYLGGEKRAKVSKDLLCKSREQGGLKLVDIECKQKALKIQWIYKMERDPFINECANVNLQPVLRECIWKCNLHRKHVNTLFPENNLWTQMLKAWCEINYVSPEGRNQCLEEIIWLNSELLIDKKPFFFEEWFRAGIVKISDIVQEDGRYTEFVTLKESAPNIKWLEYLQIVNAIPRTWKNWLKSNNEGELAGEKMYDILRSSQKVARKVYEILIDNDQALNKYANRWGEQGIIFEYEQYCKCFANLHKQTKIPKYVNFQYLLLLDKIRTNEILYEWKIVESPLCTFCSLENESLKHMLYDCIYVSDIINYLAELIESQDGERLSYISLIFNDYGINNYNIVNFVSIFIKQYIYRCRYGRKKPSINRMTVELEFLEHLEYCSAKYRGKLHKHIRKWSPVFTYLENLEINNL